MKLSESPHVIAIAGAGIAGLSAAIALKLAGFQVALFERETALEPVGAGIQLGPNATRFLESWGIGLKGSACEPEALELRAARTGTLLKSIPLGRVARTRYGAPYLTLLRADLQAALLTRLQELGISPRCETPVSGTRTGKSGVTVEAGDTLVKAAALIVAGGLNSALVEAGRVRPQRYSAQAVAWRAVLPIETVAPPRRSAVDLWMGPAAHLVHYPVSGGRLLNAVLVVDDVYRADGEPQTPATGYLLDRLSGWADEPRSIIEATEAWVPWRLFAMKKWGGGNGRVQYIGDAWHAMLPFLASGGAMAIEDAAALAASLSRGPQTIERSLNSFRKNRKARVWQAARASAQMGRIYHCAQPFDSVRDLVVKAIPAPVLLARNDWLYGAGR